MIHDSVTLDQVVAFLNELLRLDRDAVGKLLAARVPCNQAFADHPTVQVAKRGDGTYDVGILGVLNGLFGVFEAGGPVPEGHGAITLATESDYPMAFIRTDKVQEWFEKKAKEAR